MALLESLVACQGFDAEDYSQRLEVAFGKQSPYEVEAVDPENWPELKVNPTDADGQVIEEQRIWSMPLPGPWRHGSVKGFLKNYVTLQKHFPNCGSEDSQADGVAKVAPVVALLAGQPQMLSTVDSAVRVVQNTDKSAAFSCGFARVLEKIILGASAKEAIAAAVKDLRNPKRSFTTSLDEEVAAHLEKVTGELAALSHAQLGMKLKPDDAPFPFIGLS